MGLVRLRMWHFVSWGGLRVKRLGDGGGGANGRWSPSPSALLDADCDKFILLLPEKSIARPTPVQERLSEHQNSRKIIDISAAVTEEAIGFRSPEVHLNTHTSVF